MNRIFKGRYNTFINHSWQLYPVGVLFGLGFDTAAEVGVLGLSATGRHRCCRWRRLAPAAGDHQPAAAVRRRNQPHGHPRRRLHEQGIRVGLRHAHPQDLQQHHDDRLVDLCRLRHRHPSRSSACSPTSWA